MAAVNAAVAAAAATLAKVRRSSCAGVIAPGYVGM